MSNANLGAPRPTRPCRLPPAAAHSRPPPSAHRTRRRIARFGPRSPHRAAASRIATAEPACPRRAGAQAVEKEKSEKALREMRAETNAEGLTPLKLAAAEGSLRLFNHIFEKEVRAGDSPPAPPASLITCE